MRGQCQPLLAHHHERPRLRATNRTTLFTDTFNRADNADLGSDYAEGYTGRRWQTSRNACARVVVLNGGALHGRPRRRSVVPIYDRDVDDWRRG